MKKFLLLINIIFITGLVYGQNQTHIDSSFHYKLIIPEWLTVKETNLKTAFGGLLPPVNGVANAILIKSFSKSDYADMNAFKNYIIGDWKFGTHPKWSGEHSCYGLKELDDSPNIGKAYRVATFYQNKIYTCQYVLAETKIAFLWTDYTSTPDLY